MATFIITRTRGTDVKVEATRYVIGDGFVSFLDSDSFGGQQFVYSAPVDDVLAVELEGVTTEV